MSKIYEKRGVWYVVTPGEDIQSFSSEKEAKESLGYKEPSCACWDCKCEPCECDKILEGVEEDEEPVKEKTEWNLAE